MEPGTRNTLPTQSVTVSPYAPTAPSTGATAPPPDRLVRGTLVGRYIVIDLVGAGGMGAVYAAYDPELNRKVALKLLLPGSASEPIRQARLLREAQAMARLSHPNIGAIHDVGTFHEQVFFAMEFVAGVTLRAWLQARAHGWRDVLSLLVAIGRGVAAAHAVGIVHSDLKPENVMIGADGRPRVMDFGISRAERTAEEDPTLSGLIPRTDVLRTEQGAVQGTPPYMAPEQWRSGETSVLSDQFSYCVVAWEALFGERPFPVDAAARAAVGEPLRPGAPPSSARVPSWVRRTLTRGLSTRPEDRFPSMNALLDALTSGQARRRRSWLAAGAAAVALVGGGVAATRSWQQQRHVAACEAAGASIVGDVWTDEVRARVRAAMAATGIPDAESVDARVAGWTDAWTTRWKEVRTDACLASDPGPVPCLDDQRQRLAVLLEAMAEVPERGVMARAIHQAAALPDPRTCADPTLARSRPPTRGDEALSASLRRDLRRGELMTVTGRTAQAGTVIEGVRERAETEGLQVLVLEAKQAAGANAERAGDYAAAERTLREVLTAAGAAGIDDLAIASATSLVSVVGMSLGRHAEGLLFGEVAEMLVHRLGQTDRPPHARLLMHLAAVHHRAGAVREALARSERACEIFRRELGAAHPELATALDQVASLRRDLGEYREAMGLYQEAQDIATALFGPHSIEVAASQANMGTLHLYLAERAEAMALQKQAVATYTTILGPNHPDVARARSNLANVLAESGELAAALVEQREALRVFEAAMGPTHRDLGTILHDLAYAQGLSGELPAAEQNLRRALSIWEAAFDANDPRIAALLSALGEVLLMSGQPEEAVKVLERSVRIGEANGALPERLADARVALAKAVWAARRDRVGALAIAAKATAVYRAAGSARAEFLAQTEAWMREVDATPERVEPNPKRSKPAAPLHP
nr:serine/threonine-protein kinase [Nannocystis sp. RBIL2]